MANELTVVADPKFPVTVPVVLLGADVMAEINDLLGASMACAKITNATEAQGAADQLRRATKLAGQIEKCRTEVVAPFLEMQRRINAAAKAPLATIDQAKGTFKRVLDSYLAEQDRLRRLEEERLRKAAEEAARLAREAEERVRKEREEQERIAREEAARATSAHPKAVEEEIVEEDIPKPGPSKAEIEAAALAAKQAEAARAAALVPVASKPVGIVTRKTLVFSVADVTRVPETLLVPRQVDSGKVRAIYCTGWRDGDPIPSVAGLTFSVKSDVVSGR